jgi:peptidoglycan/LPS O-acetylase OafA/YrhL
MVLGSGFIPYANTFQWPYGNYASASGIFPLNLPAWSLFFEMLAYIVCFCYLALTKKRPGLIFCLGCFGVFIATIIHTKNFNSGWQAGEFLLGTARVMGGFFAGALICTLTAKPSLLKYFIAAISSISVFYFFAVGDALTVMINTFCLIPLLIWSVRSVTVQGLLKKVCVFLGFISYPLYILHIPIVTLLLHQRRAIELVPSNMRMWAAILITIILATLFGHLDLKLRKGILSAFKKGKAAKG